MANFELDNAKPNNNRMAAPPAQALDKHTPVAINASGEMVPADATNGVQGQAVGVLLTPAFDLSDLDGAHSEEFLKLRAQEEMNVIVGEGDRCTAFRNDILVTDRDEGASLDPGKPVYLAEGGGVTATAPTTSGSVVQVLGIAQSPDSYLLDPEVAVAGDVNA